MWSVDTLHGNPFAKPSAQANSIHLPANQDKPNSGLNSKDIDSRPMLYALDSSKTHLERNSFRMDSMRDEVEETTSGVRKSSLGAQDTQTTAFLATHDQKRGDSNGTSTAYISSLPHLSSHGSSISEPPQISGSVPSGTPGPPGGGKKKKKR